MDPKNPAILAQLKERFDQILAKPIRESLAFGQLPHTPGVEATDRWTWSDALYMAPPALVRLTQVTGDGRYLKFVDAEFKAAYDALFDRKEKLFYRDARFIGRRNANGTSGRCRWARTAARKRV